jgi:hypothetical protein
MDLIGGIFMKKLALVTALAGVCLSGALFAAHTLTFKYQSYIQPGPASSEESTVFINNNKNLPVDESGDNTTVVKVNGAINSVAVKKGYAFNYSINCPLPKATTTHYVLALTPDGSNINCKVA